MAKVAKYINTFLKILSSVIVVLLMVLAIALVGVRIFGVQVFTVLSGSMEPTYHVGSVIYVKDADPATLHVGDPVTFQINADATATHRIVDIVPSEVTPGQPCFRTKGDANDMVDAAPVEYESVIGKPFFTIPYLGFLADFIQSKTGRYISIIVVALVILLTVLSELLEDPTDPKKKKKKKNPEPKGEDDPSPDQNKKEKKQ